jgi:NADPH:quinone reductase-like Zn-dependent oxidoreductase
MNALTGVFTDKGSYAEYLTTDADLAWHVPEQTRLEDAATFGIGAVTAMQAQFVTMGFTWPDVQDGVEAQPSRVVSLPSSVTVIPLH